MEPGFKESEVGKMELKRTIIRLKQKGNPVFSVKKKGGEEENTI